MRAKMVILVFLFSVILLGCLSIGNVCALDFADWSGTWFKIKVVSETGKVGPVVPDGGDLVVTQEKTSANYLIILDWDYTQDPTAFKVGYCTFDGTSWSIQVRSKWPILGGEPTSFLTLFNYEYEQSQNVLKEYWIPLRVEGKETGHTVGAITEGSFKHLGGIFREEIGTPDVTQRGAGIAHFSGTQIPRLKVELEVPGGCRATAIP